VSKQQQLMANSPLDLSDSSLWDNGFPEEAFAELRRTAPVYYQELTDGVRSQVETDFWVCTRHAEVNTVHRDHESFTAADGPIIKPNLLADYPSLVNLDPPDHTKRRGLIAKAFTPGAVTKLEEGIQRRAHSMAARLLDNGGGELVDLAGGLPMSVIGDIVGIPESDRPRVFALVDRVLATANDPDRIPEEQVMIEIFGYATELTRSKREHPVDDIWSTLCHAEIQDEDGTAFRLPPNELEMFFFILSLAGSDTTRNALCDGIRAFVASPDQAERYRADPAVRRTAAEEVIRYSTPIMFWVRGARKDVQLGGQTIEKGARVLTMLRSANRDESVFANAMEFDIGRNPNPHVSFGGGGVHHCLGAMLARAEVRAALDELLLNTREIEVGKADIQYPHLGSQMTVYHSLPIQLTRA
jgi:cytochrome P450